MEVILIQDVDKLGRENELVKVRPGFARNFLLPNKLAVLADESQRKMMSEREKQQTRRDEKLMLEINTIMEKLRDQEFTLGAKTGTTGKIFGSVTSHQLAAEIRKQKHINIDRRKISFPEEIKTLGTYPAHIQLHKEVSVEVKVTIVAE